MHSKNKFLKLALILSFLNFSFLSLYSQESEYIIKFKSIKNLSQYQIQSSFNLIKIFKLDKNKKNKLLLQKSNNFSPELYYKITINSSNLDILKELQSDDNIEYIEKNHLYHIEKSDFPNDSFAQYQWALKAINADKTWTKANGEGIIIGVIDTGIDFEHEDLKHQLWINKKEDANGNGTFEPWSVNEIRNGVSGDFDGIDNDGNGYIDDVIGYDFVDQTYANFGDWSNPDPIPDDEGRHGTGVSGVIAAEGNNNLGIIGVAYKSKILTARVFDATGNAESDDIATGIIYAVMNGAKVINMSFGDTFESLLLRDAIAFAKSMSCILVASSGNENADTPHYPSDFDGVISVGASNSKNVRSSISNYGVNLSLLAPGEDILTCEAGNSYARLSGTSFSAPYVSAACALLIQLHPDLTSSEVRSTLEAQTQKIDVNGWNKFEGAGILDLESLLNTHGISNFDIFNIPNYSFWDNNDKLINLGLSVKTPLFDSWQIDYSYIDSNNYTPISDVNFKQTITNQVLPIDISKIGKDFLVSLKISLKNGQILRRQKAVRVNISADSFSVDFISVNPAIQNGKRVYVISARTNFPSQFWIEYESVDKPNLILRKDEEIKFAKNHIIILNDLFNKGKYKGKAFYALKNIYGNLQDTLMKEFEFINEPQIFPTTNYSEKSYTLPRAYLNNIIKDLYNDGKKSIIVNNMQDFLIGNAEVYEFSNNKFTKRDTLKDWIPVDCGDTRGLGNTEILFTQNAKTQISTYDTLGKSPFSNILFSSTLGKTFWAEGLYDIDKDGKDEILAYNDTTFFTYKFENNNYSLYQNLDLQSKNKKGVTKGSVAGDFDGDGNIEVFYSNYYGNLFIFEFKNGKFNLEWSDTTNYGYSNPVVTKINLPGESNPSIVIGTFGSNLLFNSEDNYDVIWSYRIIHSDKQNSYQASNFENILGVRAGIDPRLRLSFRNGITSGNLDADSGDELVISAFPNTYVMKWNGEKFEPFWQYKYSFTNSAIINDFDGNGLNELGIATYDSTRFFEILPKTGKPPIPVVYDAYAFSDKETILKWFNVPNIKKYLVYYLTPRNDGSFSINLLKESSTDSVIISDLTPNSFHYFLVTSIDSSQSIFESDFSELQSVYTHNPVLPLKLDAQIKNFLNVNFSGKLSKFLEDMSIFEVFSETKEFVASPSSIQAINDTVYVLTLPKSFKTGKYILKIKSFRDFWNSPTISDEINFEIIDKETPAELFLTSLEIFSPTLYKLSFSEPLEKISCEMPDNYLINPWGKVLIASYNDSTSVFLRLDDEIANRNITGEWYSITAKNIFAASGHNMTKGSGNTLSFVLTKDNLDGVIAFPNPFSLSKDEYLRFGNLSKEVEIQIMNLNGKELMKITDKSADGGAIWDLRDLNGKKLESGIYIFKVSGKNSNGEEILWEMKKFAVLP